MPGLTKNHPTKSIEIRFIGPFEKRDQAVQRLKPLGFVDASEAEYVSWRELFSEYSDEEMPGSCLRGARFKESLTQQQLADRIGIPQRHISMMETGKRPIGKEMAKRLGKALNINYKVFL
ncbi:MAG: helix-turn-helix domain-containing protein [Syntrophobacterales bacterium]|nr:helix-turn-helix domain-containing protein [Syntrophobacterales bacterium]